VVVYLCCMALTASEVYRITAESLRQLRSEEGLDCEGPVRLLRQRLVRHLTDNSMESKDVDFLQRTVDVFSPLGSC